MEATAKKVFVSYARENTGFVEKLVRSLEKSGIAVWFDRNIRTGTQWDEVLEKQIREADNLVIVLSRDSVRSDYVKNEMFYAQQHDTTVNLILIEECKLPLAMARMHYIDFTQGYEQGIARLVADINYEAVSAQQAIERDPDRKSVPWTRYGIGALLVAGLIAALIWQWPPEGQEPEIINNDPIGNTDNQDPDGTGNLPEEPEDPEWRKIANSEEIDDFSAYLGINGDSEGHIDDAVVKIQELLNDEGAVIINKTEFRNYFFKFIYKNPNGRYQVNDINGPNLDWPQQGDILVSRKNMAVMDPLTQDVKKGIRLLPGKKVEYWEIKDESPTVVMIKFYFKHESTEEEMFTNTDAY